MDGFLAKPYTLAALQVALAAWLPAAADAPPAPAPLPAPQAAPAAGVLDPAALAMLRELDEAGGEALVQQLVQTFLDAADAGLAKVDAAARSGDARALAQAAHALKSSAGTLGAQALAECYRELEKCGREGRAEAACALLERTAAAQAHAVEALRGVLLEAA